MDFALSLDDVIGIDRHGLWRALGAAGLGLLGGLASLAPGRGRPSRYEERHLREAA